MKKLIGILVLFVAMSTVNLNANTVTTLEVVGGGGCWDEANAIEVAVCGYVGCNFELWDTAYAYCQGWEIIYQ